jgi:peptidyl-prolyl cis-trans isomerase SurA
MAALILPQLPVSLFASTEGNLALVTGLRRDVLRQTAMGLLVAVALIVVPTSFTKTAEAQSIVVVVNGMGITENDISSRQRLLALSNRGRLPPRATVVEELITERLKQHEASRLRITVPEQDVTRQFNSIAERVRLTPERMIAEFGRIGITPRTLRERLAADMAWNQVVQARLQRMAPIREQDVIDALRARGQDPDTVRTFEYLAAQAIVFVAANAPPAAVRTAQVNAERLRSSVNGCDSMVERVRAIPNAAVREPARRNGNDIPRQLREVMDRVQLGRATPPIRGPQGFDLIIVCERKEISGREGVTEEMRRELAEREAGGAADRFLNELRQAARIERRR